jgi:hypothetical protein
VIGGIDRFGWNPERGAPAALTVWSLALFIAVLWLDTRHNDFPYFYHPDEGVKVEQVRTGNWNFHHPMLLLTATRSAVALGGVPPQEQRIVEAGRWVSAGFTALAVVALSLLAFSWRGWGAGIVTGLTLLLHHQLFELSHYLKEDTALLFGVALTFLATFQYARNPSTAWVVVLGLAAACAISGKYVGVFVLAVAIPVLWAQPTPRVVSRWAVFAVALVAGLVVINLPLILHPAAFAHSFDREMRMVAPGQDGAAHSVPHVQYLNIFRDNTTPVLWVLLVVFLVQRWRQRDDLKLVEKLIIAFPFAYTLALSFSPKTNDRYFLPVSALFALFAAIGAVDVAALLRRRWPHPAWGMAPAVFLVAAQVFCLPAPADWKTLPEYFAAFQHDDNRALFEWVKAHLPPDAVIVKDSRIFLPDPENPKDAVRFEPLPQKVFAKKYAADFGSFSELRQQGVTHIAISETDYGGFFRAGARPKKSEAAEFERRKDFYLALLREGEPLFQRERGAVLYLHPGMRVYAVPSGG